MSRCGVVVRLKLKLIRGRRTAVFLLAFAATTVVGCTATEVGVSRNELPRSVPSVAPGSELSAALSAYEKGNFGYSAKYFEMAAEKSPRNMTACLGMAASYDWLYRFDLADQAYSTCNRIEGNSFSYHNNKGFSYLLRGDYDKASASFNRAKQIRPNDPVVETNLKVLRDAASN